MTDNKSNDAEPLEDTTSGFEAGASSGTANDFWLPDYFNIDDPNELNAIIRQMEKTQAIRDYLDACTQYEQMFEKKYKKLYPVVARINKNGEFRIGPRLRFRRYRDGRLRLNIELNHETTIEDIRKGWKHITTWRNLLLYYQGPDLTPRTILIAHLYELNKVDELSPSEIANLYNDKYKKILTHHFELMKDETYRYTYTTHREPSVIGESLIMGKVIAENVPCFCPYLLEVKDDLTRFGFSEADIDLWIDEASKRFEQGRSMFPPEYPISTSKIRELIRTFKGNHEDRDFDETYLFFEDDSLYD